MVALLTPSPLRLTAAAETAAPGAGAAPHQGLALAGAAQPSGRERRMFPRKECHARVEGRRLDHSIPARQQPQLSLALRDLSVGGLSAVSQTPVGVGEQIAVYFPPQGAQRGWDARGRIIRCEPAALGYRVAVEFDALPLAA